jgi:hypothetical protein
MRSGGDDASELNFKGKEFVYNHHLAVPFRPLVPGIVIRKYLFGLSHMLGVAAH